MEIAMDQGWNLDLGASLSALQAGREESRGYGEYIADTRSKERLHQVEQAQVSGPKPSLAD